MHGLGQSLGQTHSVFFVAFFTCFTFPPIANEVDIKVVAMIAKNIFFIIYFLGNQIFFTDFIYAKGCSGGCQHSEIKPNVELLLNAVTLSGNRDNFKALLFCIGIKKKFPFAQAMNGLQPSEQFLFSLLFPLSAFSFLWHILVHVTLSEHIFVAL